jgi:hypothetical protein
MAPMRWTATAVADRGQRWHDHLVAGPDAEGE